MCGIDGHSADVRPRISFPICPILSGQTQPSRQDSSSSVVSANSYLGLIQKQKKPTRARGTSGPAPQMGSLAVVSRSRRGTYWPSVHEYWVISDLWPNIRRYSLFCQDDISTRGSRAPPATAPPPGKTTCPRRGLVIGRIGRRDP